MNHWLPAVILFGLALQGLWLVWRIGRIERKQSEIIEKHNGICEAQQQFADCHNNLVKQCTATANEFAVAHAAFIEKHNELVTAFNQLLDSHKAMQDWANNWHGGWTKEGESWKPEGWTPDDDDTDSD